MDEYRWKKPHRSSRCTPFRPRPSRTLYQRPRDSPRRRRSLSSFLLSSKVRGCHCPSFPRGELRTPQPFQPPCLGRPNSQLRTVWRASSPRRVRRLSRSRNQLRRFTRASSMTTSPLPASLRLKALSQASPCPSPRRLGAPNPTEAYLADDFRCTDACPANLQPSRSRTTPGLIRSSDEIQRYRLQYDAVIK